MNAIALPTVDTFLNNVWCYDAETLLRSLPENSVHCIVTSPPYYGLRDYKTAEWVGGDPTCEHKTRPASSTPATSTLGGGKRNVNHAHEGYRDVCPRCGAVRVDEQIGLERTPEQYIDRLVGIFRLARRVLRADGVMFVNMGDSYAADVSGKCDLSRGQFNKHRQSKGFEYHIQSNRNGQSGLAAKNLMGMPWRLAFALQDAGWILREDIVWSKTNSMPESVDNRCTRAHEYVFRFAKSNTAQFWTHRDGAGSRVKPKPDYRWIDQLTGEETAIEPENWRDIRLPDGQKRWRRFNLWRGHDYWSDMDGIREPLSESSIQRISQATFDQQQGGPKDPRNGGDGSRNRSARQGLENLKDAYQNGRGANKRSVWNISSEPTPLPHYAAFPQALVEPCLLAGCPKFTCPHCGAGYMRVTEKTFEPQPDVSLQRGLYRGKIYEENHWVGFPRGTTRVQTLGFAPSCSCPQDAPPGAGIVLDPFMGVGTTALVAQKHNRDYIGCDLNTETVELARLRILYRGDDKRLMKEQASGVMQIPLSA